MDSQMLPDLNSANLDPQMDELQALVRSSRAEQAAISSKILALKGGVSTPQPSLKMSLGAPGVLAGAEEVTSLREQLAEVDHMLLQKDAQVETLTSQLLQLRQVVAAPQSGAEWRRRYEDAQKNYEQLQRDVQHIRQDAEKSRTALSSMTSYLKVLESDKRSSDAQRERLVKELKKHTEKNRSHEDEKSSIAHQLRCLEEAFLVCVGRVTHSLAAGVATIVLNGKAPEARFTTLRANSNGEGVIEIFREPDADEEIFAMELSVAGGASAVAEGAEGADPTILLTSSSGNDNENLRICCVSNEEFMKWTGALKTVGLDCTISKAETTGWRKKK